jgi:hypothetical protein
MSRTNNWRARAACAGHWELFEPPVLGGDRDEKVAYEKRAAQARVICACCPVLLPCREFGLTNDVGGIVGGLDDLERREIRKERAS